MGTLTFQCFSCEKKNTKYVENTIFGEEKVQRSFEPVHTISAYFVHTADFQVVFIATSFLKHNGFQ